MKKLLFSIAFAIIVTGAYSQGNFKKFNIGANIGPSVPIMFYDSFTYLFDGGGYALIGINKSISLSYKLNEELGLELYGYSVNHIINEFKMNEDINELNPNYIYVNKFGKWKLNGLLIGPKYFLKANRIEFTAKFLFGYNRAISPYLYMHASNINETVILTQHESISHTISGLAGLGLNVYIFENFYLNFCGDLFYSHPKFNVKLEDGNGEITYDETYQSISTIDLFIGLGFVFDSDKS